MTVLNFFAANASQAAFVLSILSAILITRYTEKGRQGALRAFFAGILFWAPCFLIAKMALHLGHYSITAFLSIGSGQAVFAFYHYSLVLFCVVTGVQAFLMLRECIRHVMGSARWNRKLFFHIGRIAVTFVPAAFLLPLQPAAALVLIPALVASAWVHRPAGKESGPVSVSLRPHVPGLKRSGAGSC